MSYRNYPNNPSTKRNTKKVSKLSEFAKLPPVNKNLLIVVAMLIIFGIVSIFSASVPEGIERFQDPLYFPKKHIGWVIAGIISMCYISTINYKKWENVVHVVAFVVLVLIGMTLIPGLGRTDYGSSRWLTFLPIQPSEFGKLVCILLMADCLSKAKNLLNPTVKFNGLLILIMLGIILLQPNLSMFMLLTLTIIAMLFVNGLDKMVFAAAGVFVVPCIGFYILKHAYQSTRIVGWLDPESDPLGKGYNIIQSWYAIASGGLLGAGLGNSKQKLYYLPVGYTDFVFSIIAEEMGFVGITVLILLFLLFITFGFKVASRCEDLFGRLLAFGIVFNIGIQAFINMCVASGLFPVTGVTLPLISYGGSSYIATCLMIGILFNISRYPKKERTMASEKA